MTFEANLRNFLLGDYDARGRAARPAANEPHLSARAAGGSRRTSARSSIRSSPTPAANLEAATSATTSPATSSSVRVQLDVWAKSYDEARALARLVQARMNCGQRIDSRVRISRRAMTIRILASREILDYSVWHSPQ
jgi:hypothetical protein